MNVARLLDNLVPNAAYFGSLTANTKAAYDALEWLDARAMPTWGDIEAEAAATAKAGLVAYAADARWRKEIGGLDVGGTNVATDRGSQAMIAGADAYLQISPEATIRFKAAGGFVTLDAEAMRAVALAVGAHVQACFALEADVQAAIEAGTITSTGEIDDAFAG